MGDGGEGGFGLGGGGGTWKYQACPWLQPGTQTIGPFTEDDLPDPADLKAKRGGSLNSVLSVFVKGTID